MARKIGRLTLDHLRMLDEHPRTCLRWQLDAVARSRVEPHERAGELEAWVSELLREWGSCGRVVLVDDEPVGVALYAPAAYLGGLGDLPTAPPSPDAIVLASLYVAPSERRGGLARMLVQGTARDLIERGFGAVESFGDVRGPGSGADPCLLPVDFWGSVGFKTQRAHSTTPRMRMDLRTARSWKSEVEQALERLVGAVRPAIRPQGKTVRSDPRAP